ncbi:MAG: DUF3822 family protein [Mariniphaga sp.]|nr:DUF3822 family protein [Mariniphaga sp.]MDD4226765.1 DUF3822 family protein [Mariniphaga sp.]
METVITDPAFDHQRTEEYKLSIQVSLDGFYFTILQPDKNKLMKLVDYPASIRSEHFLLRRFTEWYDNHDLLSQNYAAIRVICPTDKFTLVPGEFYNYEKQRHLAGLTFQLEEDFRVFDNYLPELAGNLLFAIPNDLHLFLDQKFIRYRLVHPLAVIFPHITIIAEQFKNTLLLLFENKRLYLMLFANKTLLVANSFYYSHPNDVVYYVLSVINQHHIPRKDVTPFTAGKIAEDDPIYSQLKKHFSNVGLFLPRINCHNAFYKVPLQHFNSLF